MRVKVHFLHSLLDFFPLRWGVVEQNERFHENIQNKGNKVQG